MLSSSLTLTNSRRFTQFLLRILFESNFLLSFGFIVAMVSQTLWIIGRTPAFSLQTTPAVFKDLLWSLFGVSLSCFLVYFIIFSWFLAIRRISWIKVRKTLLTIIITVFITVLFLKLAIVRANFTTALNAISPERMFYYFFPFILLCAFIGISVATRFFFDLKDNSKRDGALNLVKPDNLTASSSVKNAKKT